MEETVIVEKDYKEGYSRFKGMSWFPAIYKKDLLVIGQGGIGSWLSLLLARTGAVLHTFDFDNFDTINLAGQLVRKSDVNKNKAVAISEIINEFCEESVVNIYQEKYTKDSISNNIVLMGVDNMEARKIGFENWVEYVATDLEDAENCLFIDGRLTATAFQIFCIRGNDKESINKYREEYLFSDSEVNEEECTMKQTSHCSAMIAGHMVSFLTNFLSPEKFEVPFYYSYIIPINYTENIC